MCVLTGNISIEIKIKLNEWDLGYYIGECMKK